VHADDRSFTITSWTLSLLELVPDTKSKSYRIDAQVLHEKSDTAGEVGLYFGRGPFPGGLSDVQFFTQLTFNAVRGQRCPPTRSNSRSLRGTTWCG
jgi:serine/threonine-protein kinase